MPTGNLHLLRGTVDLLILKALSGGPRHGYAVSEWIAGATRDSLVLEEGTLYPALHRLENKGLLESRWGVSSNNRRAKFYDLTAAGRTQLEEETRQWSAYTEAVERALATPVTA